MEISFAIISDSGKYWSNTQGWIEEYMWAECFTTMGLAQELIDSLNLKAGVDLVAVYL